MNTIDAIRRGAVTPRFIVAAIAGLLLLTCFAAPGAGPAASKGIGPATASDMPAGWLFDLEASYEFLTLPAKIRLPDARRRTMSETLRSIARGPAELKRARAEAAKAGIPLSAAWFRVKAPSPSRNAAPDYERLRAVLQKRRLSDEEFDLIDYGRHGRSSPAEDRDVRAALAAHRDALAVLHRAVSKPECVFHRQWELGPNLLFPQLPIFREGENLLRAESYLLAKDGHWPDAIQNQALGLHLGDQVAAEPTFLTYLTAVGCDEMALRGFEDLLVLSGPAASNAGCVERVLIGWHPRLDFRRALEGHVVFVEIGMKMLRDTPPAELANRLPGWAEFGWVSKTDAAPKAIVTPAGRRFALQVLNAADAQILDDLRQLIEAAGKPLPARLDTMSRLDKEFTQKELEESHQENPVGWLTSAGRGDYANAGAREADVEAQRAVDLAAAALLLYRVKHGIYPNRLTAALTPALARQTVDPYSGGPVKYRREGAGFVAYSVGRSGHFNGKPGEDTRREIYFRYPYAPHT